MANTTALCTSFKQECLQSGHNFNASAIITATCASGSASVTGASSMANVIVGMGVTGTSIPASTVVARTTSSTAFTLSANTTGAISGGNLTISPDVFKIALLKAVPSGTWNETATNYGAGSGSPTTSNMGTDECTGTGYTAGGLTLTNVSPAVSGTTAYVTFSPDPSWTGATFSTSGCMIYNASARMGGVFNRSVSVHDLGVQSVSSGSLTLVMPAATSSTAIIRLQ